MNEQKKNSNNTAKPEVKQTDIMPAIPIPPTPVVPVENPEEKKAKEKFAQKAKELEQAIFSIKFYPVAVKADAKDAAKEVLKENYRKEDETTRQLVLYMLHEALSQSGEMKTMFNFENFKRKFPNADPAQLRINVYRSMFNYNFSLEGLMELIKLLGELGDDDASKVLTYHFSFLSSIEVESAHMLRNAIIEALGNSQSAYALNCLIEYAKYTDNERLFQRIAAELMKWDARFEELKLPKKDKDRLRVELDKIFTLELGGTHYG